MSYNRMYYTIGQVSKIAGLPQSVLRYWETVFVSLNPPKSEGGTRQYTENNVEIVIEIKKLLYDEGYTIKGANKHIKEKYETSHGSDNEKLNPDTMPTIPSESNTSTIDNSTIKDIKQKIYSIIELLDE